MPSDLFDGNLPIPLAAQIAEVEREVEMRRRVYRRPVKLNQMRQADADIRIATMVAALVSLRGIA